VERDPRKLEDVSPNHLLEAASASCSVLEPCVEQDWAVPAGDLTWDVRKTVTHFIDAVGWYAAHLAAQSPRRLRVDFVAHDDATNEELLDVLAAAAAMLAQVATATTPSARAYHEFGMADTGGFLAMGCDEILVHTWDASRGLGVVFAPPEGLADRVLRRLFPWAQLDAPPWQALLWANGRVDIPGQPQRPGPDWAWHCAPLDEWDGTVPLSDSNPPRRYRWEEGRAVGTQSGDVGR